MCNISKYKAKYQGKRDYFDISKKLFLEKDLKKRIANYLIFLYFSTENHIRNLNQLKICLAPRYGIARSNVNCYNSNLLV